MLQYLMYRPKADKKGLAAQFQVNNDACYLKLARQETSSGEYDKFSWQKKGEHSDGTKNLNVKMGLSDLGSILSVFNNRQPETTLFHKFTGKDGVENTTVIAVAKYANKEGVAKGYSVNVSKNKEKYGFILSYTDVEVVRSMFNEAILNQLTVNFEKSE